MMAFGVVLIMAASIIWWMFDIKDRDSLVRFSVSFFALTGWGLCIASVIKWLWEVMP